MVGLILLIGAALALSAWQAQLSRDSSAAHWIVGVTIAVAVMSAVVLGRHRQRQTTHDWIADVARGVRTRRAQPSGTTISVLFLIVLLGGVIAWDLTSFVAQSPRLPTLSFFIGHVTRYRIGRGLVFALWLGVGSFLALAWRTRRPK
jgi:hypothetical protein